MPCRARRSLRRCAPVSKRCHRWDAGTSITATPAKHTFGFFNKNLVMEYDHERAVADGVNVDFEVYDIRTRITGGGATIEAKPETMVEYRDRQTRARRWERPDDDITYAAAELDRRVVARDQIRTVVRTFRDRLFTDLFPGRREVPKTLVFAKDDSHAEDIVEIVRDEFGRGNDFCQKITYKVTAAEPRDLIQAFRNSFEPRIAVTVDMISTGADIKPIEIVMFMRAVKSRGTSSSAVAAGMVPPAPSTAMRACVGSASMPMPSCLSPSMHASVSSLNSAPRSVDRPVASAATTSARLVRLFEPGTVTVPLTGPAAGTTS